MKRLTMRSSSEWKLITASRPPGFRRAYAASRPVSRSASSRLMKMRIAWKLRVAGWIFWSPRGTTEAISSASCAVRVIGCSARRATMRARDPARHALLAVGPQHVGDLALVGARQPLRRALAAVRIHAHVERAVLAEAEAALGDVELRRGHAEVEQHAVEPVGGRIPVRELGEAAAADRDARVAAELAFGHGDRLGILVHQQQPASGPELFQHRRAHGRRARRCHPGTFRP